MKRYIIIASAITSAAFGTIPLQYGLDEPKTLPPEPRKLPRIDEPPDVPANAERRPKERRRLQKLWGKRP